MNIERFSNAIGMELLRFHFEVFDLILLLMCFLGFET